MIAKKVPNDPAKADNMGRISRYFAAAPGHKNASAEAELPDNYDELSQYMASNAQDEKLDKFWIENCPGLTELEDLEYALVDIEAVRRQRPDLKTKTYHMIVSFRPGEGENLTAEELKDIEHNFANALGFNEHQRVVATHKNTQNYHMHVAYNMVHPETHKRHEPSHDYRILERTARKMEKKYGLFVDRGMSDQVKGLSQSSRNEEARTWQQSFESYIHEHEAGITQAINQSGHWQDLHENLTDFNIGLKKRGAGLAFHDLNGKRSVKATTLGRQYSLQKMEERLGPYQPAMERQKERDPDWKPRSTYDAKPLTRHPGQKGLLQNFLRNKKQPGFLKRHFGVGTWKDYLMADAHKDALAMATIIFYRELLYIAETSVSHTNVRPPNKTPAALNPALQRWFNRQDWLPSGETPLERPGQLDGIGLRIDDDNRILFPMRDAKGVIWSIRAMDENGNTTDIQDKKPRLGLYHTLDRKKLLNTLNGPYNGPIILAVDCTSATTVHKHTSAPVILVADEKDLANLAKATREKHNSCQILIMANMDNTFARSAAETVSGRHVDVQNTMALAPDLADKVRINTPSPLDSKKLLHPKKKYPGPIILTSLRDTGTELHKATGIPVVAVELDKDLPKQAKELRAQFDKNDIIIIANEEAVPAQKAAQIIQGTLKSGPQVVLETKQLKKRGPRAQQQTSREL